jgi:error-prone DNA polymerase
MSYAELQVTTNFSFLRGASHPQELFARAAELGITALGIADRHSLAGIVRAHVAARETGVRLVVGCRLDLDDGPSVAVYPTDRAAYGRLCRLLSCGKARAGKGACRLGWADLVAWGEGQIVVLLPDEADDELTRRLRLLRAGFAGRAYLALTLRRAPGDALRLYRLEQAAVSAGIPTIVTNDVLYHVPERRILQDVVTCIREGCTIDAAGYRRERCADRFLKAPAEMARLFKRHPEALARTQELAERCRFSLADLEYQYPSEVDHADEPAQARLERLVREGTAWHYPEGACDTILRQLDHELRLIARMRYAPYFLTVNAIVRFARSRGILCQGRGSAANSLVCYVLGITSIGPDRIDVLFERFISEERGEPPDIDVDFEHERREEVIQWIYKTYGLDHAALTAVVTRYRTKGSIRDVGKVMGLSEDLITAVSTLARTHGEEGIHEQDAAALNINLADRRIRLTLDLAAALRGFPRHLSQHPGGFVLTRDRLDELVPIEPAAMVDRQVIEWDKDDIDVLKFMKVDVLGLGMLGCLRRVFDLLRDHKGIDLDLATIPPEDPATYAMICKADTVGVFQIESRAQMSMLPRLKPREFYDLVIEVAIVRPGPIQGDMVHPYLRRRDGTDPVEYPDDRLKGVLGKTLGVPLFQEQAMRVAIECAGFTPGEADKLRRAMATFKHTGTISSFGAKLVAGMVANGYTADYAARVFKQLEGFGSYGFPESHAASFALLVYASSWIKRHHPEVFCCAILNAQPMGFYAPAQLVRDARAHGVEVRPVDVNRSRWDCSLEPDGRGGFAVRLGLRLVKGLANAHGAALVAARGDTAFAAIADLQERSGIPVAALERLADADAFAPAVALSRRPALWAIRGLHDTALPLFAAAQARELVEPEVALAALGEGGEVMADYGATGLSLRRHPLAFLRDDLAGRGIRPLEEVAAARDGKRVTVAGLVLIRQRPGSAKGVVFVTLEDETGHANLVIWPDLFARDRRLILTTRLLCCRGRVQREGEVIHLVAERLEDLTPWLGRVARSSEAADVRRFRARDFR